MKDESAAIELALEFLDHLGEFGSEPLNSINGYRDKKTRGYFTAKLRMDARNCAAKIRTRLEASTDD